MTIDQRLEFLLQSTESLHATTLEQSAQIRNQLEMLSIDANNIRRLAEIAAIHDGAIEDLGERLDRLEKR